MPGSTTSSVFPDINVWLALTYDRHEHHAIARRWFETVDQGRRAFFCRLTQLGLLRLLSSEAIMRPDAVMNQPAAWEAYDRWRADDRVGFLDEPADLDPQFRALTRLRHRRRKTGRILTWQRLRQCPISRSSRSTARCNASPVEPCF